MSETTATKTLADIPGWFSALDQFVFEHFLSKGAVVSKGDVVELGAYLGKSAAFTGKFVAEDELFTVCDLFGASAGDDANDYENSTSYKNLTLDAFKTNYLTLNDTLPNIVQGLTSTILDHVKPGTARFVHVDASHLYEHVYVDVASTETMLCENGIVAFDDFRTAHTPGVSAAVWEAVFNRGLKPVCVTSQKLYGTFGDPSRHQMALLGKLQGAPGYWHEVQQVNGDALIRIVAR